MSTVERAYNYDESISDNKIEIGLVLMHDGDSYSEVGSFYLSFFFMICIMVGFVIIAYYFILPPGIKKNLMDLNWVLSFFRR